MEPYVTVKNWLKYQHYSKRNPPWIKLYNRMLDDYDLDGLSDVDKWHLVAIFLLASRYQNRIPADPAWIQKKIGASHEINFKILISNGFIECYPDDSVLLAACKQNGASETETETETETERETKREKDPPNPPPKRGAGKKKQIKKRKRPPKDPEPETSEFKHFYETAYPRKTDREAAWRAWQKAVKNGAAPADLLSAAGYYAEAMLRQGREVTEMKYPASFINGGLWKNFVKCIPEGERVKKKGGDGQIDYTDADYDDLPEGLR